MSVPLYFDHNAERTVALGLRRRGVDVLTAQEDGTTRLADDRLLERATQLHRVLYTHDRDLLVITARWRQAGQDYAGLVYVRLNRLTVREQIDDLEIYAQASNLDQVVNTVTYLPL